MLTSLGVQFGLGSTMGTFEPLLSNRVGSRHGDQAPTLEDAEEQVLA